MTARAELAEVPAVSTMYLFAALAAMRPLLRPSARIELATYAQAHITSREDIEELAKWMRTVLVTLRAPDGPDFRAARARVNEAPRGVFRRPARAFQMRAEFDLMLDDIEG